MADRLTQCFASRWGIVLAGAVIGVLAPLLQTLGNPANMGICVACFERDIAGALGLHRAAAVQYIRPAVVGFVLGAMLAAYAFPEFRARAGAAPIVRFVLGVFAMVGALAFLGCPGSPIAGLSGWLPGLWMKQRRREPHEHGMSWVGWTRPTRATAITRGRIQRSSKRGKGSCRLKGQPVRGVTRREWDEQP